jgi:hypothetical protein
MGWFLGEMVYFEGLKSFERRGSEGFAENAEKKYQNKTKYKMH